MNDNLPSTKPRFYCHVCLLLSGEHVYQVWRNTRITDNAHEFFKQVAEYFRDQPSARLLACVLFYVGQHKDNYYVELAGKPLMRDDRVVLWHTHEAAVAGAVAYLKQHNL